MSNILIAGGTGFIGLHLSRLLLDLGHEVRHVSRRANRQAEFPAYGWDINSMTIERDAIANADVVINLAGAGIADKRWTKKRKQTIIDSRVKTTALLAQAIREGVTRPKLYINSSAVGYYGNQGDKICLETDAPGEGFLSESCLAWEQSVTPIQQMGIPTAIVRTGIVLHPKGGALQKMLLPLKVWNSTYFGNGEQWYSWIHMLDICRIYAYLIEHQLAGTFNAVAPNPAQNKTLAKTLPRAAGKRALVSPAPAFALRLLFGEMADTILDSTRCSAEKIQAAEFQFQFPELEAALRDLLR